jgi:GINS complex subunit 4
VEEQTGKTDPQTNFKLVVMQTDLERVKFMVRSLLRARLAKVRLPASSNSHEKHS